MKTLFGRYGWAVALLTVAGALMLLGSAPVSAEQSPFEQLRRQMPAKLDLLRDRVDEAGGQDLSLALFLAVQSEDAHTVGTTVLVYQQYPRERKLAILLAAAVKYHKEMSLMQRVEDQSLKQALAEAPAEMEGINGMFQTVQDSLSMTPLRFRADTLRRLQPLQRPETSRHHPSPRRPRPSCQATRCTTPPPRRRPRLLR